MGKDTCVCFTRQKQIARDHVLAKTSCTITLGMLIRSVAASVTPASLDLTAPRWNARPVRMSWEAGAASLARFALDVVFATRALETANASADIPVTGARRRTPTTNSC